ncbi:MAG: triple tyrosine motif-containing protein [Flavobacteriales bacterium]
MQRLRNCLSSWYRVPFIVLAFFVSFDASAQVYSFRHYGLDKNVFPSRIECIEQSTTGKLYIGTLAGLVVYDGYAFNQFSVRDGLGENAISSIAIKNEQVWLGHWAGSISIINSLTGSISTINLQQQVNYSSIMAMVPLKDSAAIFLTREGRLFHYTNSGVEQVLITGAPTSLKILDIGRSQQSDLYVITDHGVFTNDDEAYTNWNYVYESKESSIQAAYRLQPAEWLVCSASDIRIVNTQTGQSELVHSNVIETKVVSIVQDMEEYLWIGTAEQGIIRYHPILKEKTLIKRDNGLSYNQIREIFMDREGTVWVATAAGLDQYLGNAFVLYEKRAGLPDNLVWDFIKCPEGFLVATQEGLFMLTSLMPRGRPENVIPITLGEAEPRKLYATANAQVIYAVDANGQLWRGGYSGSYKRLESIPEAVRCLAEVNGEIWVGTDNGVYKLEDDKPTEHYTRETGLGGDRVNGIYYSKVKNETWITSLGSAATLYRDGRFKLFGAEQGLRSSVIQDLAFDKDGDPWLATYDDGVYFMDEGQFKNLSEKVTLETTTTFAIEIDDDQSVWIGHSWGLDRYRMSFEDLNSYSSDDGFMGIEVNPGTIKCDDRGNLWMGTLMGLLMFKPTDHRLNLTEPVTRIISATVGNHDVIAQNEVRQSDLSGTDFKVSFEGVSLVNPITNKFEYRLIGVHENWRTITYGLPIEYQSLAPGTYRFELRTCNNSGHCNVEPKVVEFSIAPPFYKTWWFYTFVFLIIVLAIYFMDRYRVLALLDERNALATQLADKEQYLVEVEQEFTSLQGYRTYGLFVSKALSEHAIQDNSALVKSISASGISSDHLFSLQYNNMNVNVLLDIGVADASGAHMVDHIRLRFYELAQNSIITTEEDMLTQFKLAIQQTVSILDKHKGAKWVFWFKRDGFNLLNLEGLQFFMIEKGSVVELENQTTDERPFTALDMSQRIFISTDGLFDLTSDNGARVFSKKRLISKLNEHSHLDSNDLLDMMEKEISDWRGMLEQIDDITFIIINHEPRS